MNICPVCGHSISLNLFKTDDKPLTALNLPKTQKEALDGMRYPMDFYRCAFCGHVWNIKFDYTKIPYAEDSNLMFNSGSGWQDHLQQMCDLVLGYREYWEEKLVIDIGCGDGQFFSKLQQSARADYLGFEPGVDAQKIVDFEVKQDYFIPERDLKQHRPVMLVCRHVLEHLTNPRDFVSEIAYWARQYNQEIMCLFEVPCFDKALKDARATDFLYEHVQNFTKRSFQTLFDTSGYYTCHLDRYYNDEVLAAFVILKHGQTSDNVAGHFKNNWTAKENLVQLILTELHKTYKRVVFWGGTGKGAAFLNLFKIDMKRFPYVVDSDIHKVGRYVPGTGQLIQHSSKLATLRPDAIVITTPWRCKDICTEIKNLGVDCPVYTLNTHGLRQVNNGFI